MPVSFALCLAYALAVPSFPAVILRFVVVKPYLFFFRTSSSRPCIIFVYAARYSPGFASITKYKRQIQIPP